MESCVARYLEEHVKNERFNTKLAKEKLKKLRHIAMQQQDDIVKTERAKSHKIDPTNPCVSSLSNFSEHPSHGGAVESSLTALCQVSECLTERVLTNE